MRKLLRLGLFGIVVGLFLAGNVWSADFAAISAKELKAKLDAGEDLMLINPLSDIEFNEGHIPGSVNIPLHHLARSESLPINKETLIVTYCLGPK